jgi:hypothetical protein
MIKKLAIMLALVAGFAVADTPDANAWGYRRVAPVRRVLAPPYPVARAAVVGPRYYARPVTYGYRGPAYYGPASYNYGYRPGFSGGVYFGF